MTVKAVVFDFDGVLADSEPIHLRVFQDLLAPAGVTLTKEIYCERYLGYDDVGMMQKVSEDYRLLLGDEEIEMIVAEKAKRFEALVGTSNVLYPAAEPCVRRLGAAFALGIASGAIRADIDLMLRGAKLQDAFKFIVAAGDTDRSKPAPDPYLLAAKLHGVDAGSCVVIEDSRWGLQSARDAGMRTIGITHTYPREALPADVIVDSLDELTVALIEEVGGGRREVGG
jgi:beta-phosphoglucomutase